MRYPAVNLVKAFEFLLFFHILCHQKRLRVQFQMSLNKENSKFVRKKFFSAINFEDRNSRRRGNILFKINLKIVNNNLRVVKISFGQVNHEDTKYNTFMTILAINFKLAADESEIRNFSENKILEIKKKMIFSNFSALIFSL